MDVDEATTLARLLADVNRRTLLFLQKVAVDDATGCWLWTGYVNRYGYGSFGGGAKGASPVLAHRWAWGRWRGPLLVGLHIDHLCRVTRCVNPHHLEQVTPDENTRRALPFRPSPADGPVLDVPHGVYSSYAKKGCRCPSCRSVGSAYRRASRAALRASRGV